jgi:hypothetical protein
VKGKAEDFRRFYADLSDEALSTLDTADLTDLARQCYEAEMAARQLVHAAPLVQAPTEELEPALDEELVVASIYLHLGDALFARSLLEAEGVPAHLANEYGGLRTAGIDGLRLMVPASMLDQAREVLSTEISEADDPAEES